MITKSSRLLSPICASILMVFGYSASIGATTIRMDIAIGSQSSNSVYFELYDNVAPNTVNNFINYVSSGDYINSLIHRKAQYADGSPFVVQGGGFTYNPQFDTDARAYSIFGATNLTNISDPVTGELGLRPIGETYVVDANNDDIADVDEFGNVIIRTNEGLKGVSVDTSVLPVLSEASLSNVRGTIGMALTSSNGVINTDSASSQWFINLSDNTQLDPAGFTVFGRVLGNGMDVFDAINNLDVNPLAVNINPEFGSLPVANYEPFTRILGENIVRVTSVDVVSTVPIPSAVWLFGSGLLGLIGMARRKA